jgi:hypothetical protein
MRSVLVCGIAGTLAAATLAELQSVRTVELRGATHHVQGIDSDGSKLWVTSVERETRKGYLMEFALPGGDLLRSTDLAKGDRFHPGGLSRDGDSLWIPVAEYRRESSATIQKRSIRTLETESEFETRDHIGCIAVVPEGIVGANWDSRDFYVWDRQGKLLRKVANPTPNAYQDIKFVDGKLVGAGLLPGRKGALDWLEWPSLKLIRRIGAGATSRGVPYTNEGMALRGDRLLLLPEDGPSRLFEFRLTPEAK